MFAAQFSPTHFLEHGRGTFAGSIQELLGSTAQNQYHGGLQRTWRASRLREVHRKFQSASFAADSSEIRWRANAV